MAKKAPYKVGDIFKLKLGENIYGIGQILIVQSPSLFVGFYQRVIKEGQNISVDSLSKEKHFLKILCGDLGFKRKEWEVIGNLAFEASMSLPLFWGRDPMTNKLYLRKYNPPAERPLDMTGFIDRPTTEEEIEKESAQPDGLSGWKAAEVKLKYFLEKVGVI